MFIIKSLVILIFNGWTHQVTYFILQHKEQKSYNLKEASIYIENETTGILNIIYSILYNLYIKLTCLYLENVNYLFLTLMVLLDNMNLNILIFLFIYFSML